MLNLGIARPCHIIVNFIFKHIYTAGIYTIMTCCGVVFCLVSIYRGARCHFPFSYNYEDYYWCTQAGDREWWCAVTRNMTRDGNWGYCNFVRKG